MFELNNLVTAGEFFLEITGELILIFIAVSFLIGLLTEYLPPSRIRDFLAGRFLWVQYLLGTALGALTPFCSCSTVPITAGLLQGGVPFGPTMAFLFSSPVLNPVIIALLLSLFGLKVTAVYTIVTFFGSMLTAAQLSRFGMERQVKPLVHFQTAGCCQPAAARQPDLVTFPVLQMPNEVPAVKAGQPALRAFCCSVPTLANGDGLDAVQDSFQKIMKRAVKAAWVTFKGVSWYLVLGAGIGAFIYGFFPQDLVVTLAGPGNAWSIPVAAVLGVPMYIRAETVIPISAALVGKGMGLGTVLALLIGGAGASIPEMIILSSMFKKKLIAAFALNVFLIAIAAGYLLDLLVY
jgi:uncharacterized membrane protein YraQ (UPF0718 family)